MSTRWWQQGLRAGKLLVATPEITSGVFHMSVVFLIEHDPTDSAFSADSADGGGGSLGVVLNRPTRTPVGAVLADWHEDRGEALAWDGEALTREAILPES